MKIIKKNKTYFLNFENDKESQELDNYTNKDLEIKSINAKTLAFSVKEKQNVFSKEDIKKKIIAIIQDKTLSFKEKVEGQFENLLKKEDQEIFKEMLKNKEIMPFKQSEKYKKAIYIVNDNLNRHIIESKPTQAKSATIETKSKAPTDENADLVIKDFLKKKHTIIKTQPIAERFSKDFFIKFKNNEIKGMKSFDGYFYVIDVNIYEKTRESILKSNLQKSFALEELSNKLNKEEELLKITIEFLKEEGLIIEKKKNIYCLI